LRILVSLLLAASCAVVIANVLVTSRSPEPVAAAGVTDIAACEAHSCAVTLGAALCWGANASGQLGDGTQEDRHTPVPVATLGSGVIAIAAGGEHSCALVTGGGVKCWGRNLEGQLGDGTNSQRDEPVGVEGLGSGVVAIATGENHSCALTSGGAVKCWGDNASGQLGDGTQDPSDVPLDVLELSADVAAIGLGDNHSCAVTTQGALKCWGSNSYQQASGSASQSEIIKTPATVTGMGEGVATVDGGFGHTCAVRTAGGAWCWGLNLNGQVGNDSIIAPPAPVTPSGLSAGVVRIEAGDNHTCALLENGSVRCWGENTNGQLGDSTQDERHIPTDIAQLSSGVSALAAGGSHSCAVHAGTALCWGANGSGEIGDGTQDLRASPVGVSGLDAASKVTHTPTITPSSTPTPSPTPCPDYDVDAICDADDPDDDNDGCADAAEQQTAMGSEASGGRRDDRWFWDFFDTPAPPDHLRDQSITSADIFALIGRFTSHDAGPGPFDRTSDPLSTPNALVAGNLRANYHPAYDRGGVLAGGDLWNLDAPDGSIAASDLFAVLGQFGHACL
jgi:alpha-tubulin suppressor-like RCC1 family protein